MSDAFLEVAVDAATRSGELLRSRFGSLRHVAYKGGPTNLVTEMDGQAEALIVEAIRRRFPDHAILAEEGGASGGATAQASHVVGALGEHRVGKLSQLLGALLGRADQRGSTGTGAGERALRQAKVLSQSPLELGRQRAMIGIYPGLVDPPKVGEDTIGER